MSIRTERIAEQIKGEIARVLRDESHDPRIGMLTITRVKVSPDLATALVFWSPLDIDGETDIEEVSEGLESASGFVRRQLAHNLDLRRTPQVQFKYDPSLEQGSRTLGLLSQLDIRPEEGAKSPAGAGETDAEGEDHGASVAGEGGGSTRD